MPHPQGQHSVCGHADYRQPEVFQGQVPKGDSGPTSRGRRTSSLTGWAGRTSFRLWYTWMKKTPHLHLVFVPLTKDNRLCAKESYRQPGQSDEVAGRFSRLYGGAVPRPGAWGKRQQDGPEAYPHPAVQTGGQPSPKQARAIEAVLSGITPLNAGKKKEEALSMLKKVVSADGELLRATEKITRSQSMTC